MPPEILACNFWPLAASPGYPEAKLSWFRSDEDPLPVVDAMKSFLATRSIPDNNNYPNVKSLNNHPIAHYLLITEDTLSKAAQSSILQKFQQKYKPTVGYSIDEAILAKRVTIYGDKDTFPDTLITYLLDSGCQVERIGEDGT